jgi:hypothetical protein
MSGILDSLNPTDTHGLPVSSLPLSLHHGLLSSLTGADLADLLWSAQKFFGWITFSILNIVSAFNWLTPVVNLLETVSNTITQTLGAIGLFGIACAIALMVFVTHWLKNTTYRIGYHLGMALILMLIGVFMVSPVRFAAQTVSLGGAAASEIGQHATGANQSATISQVLATKYLREPLFRANYGANLDDIQLPDGRTCGDAFDDAVKRGVPAENVKESVLRCGPIGKQLHDYAMNPDTLSFDLMNGMTTITVLGIFVIIVCIRIMQSGVATILHAASVKPSLMTVMAGPAAQVFALRNTIAIPLGGLAVAGDLLLLVLGAAFTGFIAVATGSSAIASLITSLAMIGLILGTWRFSRNLRASGTRISEQLAQTQTRSTVALNAAQARQAVTKVITRTTSLAATLSSNPAAGAAISKLGPGVLSTPGNDQPTHQPGHYDYTGQPPALPSTHPVSAASQAAYRIQHLQPVPTPAAHHRELAPKNQHPITQQPVIPSIVPTAQPAPQPQRASRHVDNEPETEADRKRFDLRESSYTGWIDQHVNIPDSNTRFVGENRRPPLPIPTLNPDSTRQATDTAATAGRHLQNPGPPTP